MSPEGTCVEPNVLGSVNGLFDGGRRWFGRRPGGEKGLVGEKSVQQIIQIYLNGKRQNMVLPWTS